MSASFSSLSQFFEHENVEDAYKAEQEQLNIAMEENAARMRGASLYQLMTDKSLQTSLADTEENKMEHFLSGRAQMLFQVARRMIQDTGLHDDVKETFTEVVRQFTHLKTIDDISETAPQLRSKGFSLTPQEQYDFLKRAARAIDERFNALVAGSVREHTLSWKPFFKNLATLFGFGYSVVYYCLHKEWPYGDQLVVPPAERQGLVSADITLPESQGASSSGDSLLDSSRGTHYGSIHAPGAVLPLNDNRGHSAQPAFQ